MPSLKLNHYNQYTILDHQGGNVCTEIPSKLTRGTGTEYLLQLWCSPCIND